MFSRKRFTLVGESLGRLVALESGRVSEGLQGCSDERVDEGKLDFEGLGRAGEGAEVRAGQRQVPVGLAAAAG